MNCTRLLRVEVPMRLQAMHTLVPKHEALEMLLHGAERN
jgi:hypothetical protein